MRIKDWAIDTDGLPGYYRLMKLMTNQVTGTHVLPQDYAQLRMTFPDCPDSIAAKPFSKSSTGN